MYRDAYPEGWRENPREMSCQDNCTYHLLSQDLLDILSCVHHRQNPIVCEDIGGNFFEDVVCCKDMKKSS